MNRLMIALAVVSLSMFGCAAGDDDPTPEPVAQEPQRDPPKQVKSGQFANPYEGITPALNEYREPSEVPGLQSGPTPAPTPSH